MSEDCENPTPIPPPTNRKRNHFTIEKKLEIMKKMKKWIALGYTYEEMQDQLKKQGIKLSTGVLFKLALKIKEDLLDTEEMTRLIIERVEKWKFIEREALILYSKVKETNNIREQANILRILKETLREADDFLSRFNLMPAIPKREEVEVKPHVNIDEIIEYLKDDNNEKNIPK